MDRAAGSRHRQSVRHRPSPRLGPDRHPPEHMEQAGGEDFDEFCKWIDRNR